MAAGGRRRRRRRQQQQQKEAAAAAGPSGESRHERKMRRETKMQYCDITEKWYINMQTGLGVVIRSCFNLFCAARRLDVLLGQNAEELKKLRSHVTHS